MELNNLSPRAILVATALTLTAASAHAQFAPRVSSEDIEGAIMPAIPFPKEEPVRATVRQVPQSMGLAPAASEPAPVYESSSNALDADDEPKPAATDTVRPIRRGLSAQETADRLLGR